MMSLTTLSRTIRLPRRKKARKAATATDHFAIVVGSGFSGMGMAIRLRQAGVEDFILLEKEKDVGGTWYVNTYPGCACDVQSHVYSFSFEPNPNWSRAFSSQPEILEYLRHCARKYGVYEKARFGSFVVGARYDEAGQLWRVLVADADAVAEFMAGLGLPKGVNPPTDHADFPPCRELTCRVLIAGMGGLNIPAYPQLPGLEHFKGETFHSQRWNHDYELRGKRVAVIGTGASAIQFLPAIQPQVAHLDLYQRTAPWVLPKPDHAISERRQRLFRAVPGARALHRLGLFSMLESRALAFVVNPKLSKSFEAFGIRYMQAKVKDPVLREKLTPKYAMGCKRVLMSRSWYPALTQDNVEVVTSGIREVKAHAIVDQDGVERPVDALIFGTGFRVTDPIPRNVFFGRGGMDILDTWPRGPEAYKGTTVAGFPNLFLLVGPNTGLGHNSLVYMIEAQIRYVMGAISLMRSRGLCELEVRREVQDRFNARLQKKSASTVWVRGGCKSYYLDDNGKNVAVWPDFTVRFAAETRTFDAAAYHVRSAGGTRRMAPMADRADAAE